MYFYPFLILNIKIKDNAIITFFNLPLNCLKFCWLNPLSFQKLLIKSVTHVFLKLCQLLQKCI